MWVPLHPTPFPPIICAHSPSGLFGTNPSWPCLPTLPHTPRSTPPPPLSIPASFGLPVSGLREGRESGWRPAGRILQTGQDAEKAERTASRALRPGVACEHSGRADKAAERSVRALIGSPMAGGGGGGGTGEFSQLSVCLPTSPPRTLINRAPPSTWKSPYPWLLSLLHPSTPAHGTKKAVKATSYELPS